MKIESGLASLLSQLAAANSTDQASEDASQAGNANARSQTQGGDSISLGELSQAVSKAESQLTKQPVVDSGRVMHLQSAIDQGEYSVDAQRVADKMIQAELFFERNLAA